jgi:hypothetical protein
LAGEAFLTLLKDKRFKLKRDYSIKLKEESLKMLSLWNQDILEIWSEVYSLALRELMSGAEEEKEREGLVDECLKLVLRMTDLN